MVGLKKGLPLSKRAYLVSGLLEIAFCHALNFLLRALEFGFLGEGQGLTVEGLKI
jgi:hypothetical protein